MQAIYVVDDSPSDRSLTVRFLKRHAPEAEIRVCENGQEALLAFQGLAEDGAARLPSLVLLDQRMPKMNGDQLMARLREFPRLSEVPFVLFSSSVLAEDVALCLGSGCVSYVRKPLDYGEFERVVRVTAEYWLTVNVASAVPQRQGPSLR